MYNKLFFKVLIGMALSAATSVALADMTWQFQVQGKISGYSYTLNRTYLSQKMCHRMEVQVQAQLLPRHDAPGFYIMENDLIEIVKDANTRHQHNVDHLVLVEFDAPDGSVC